MKIALVRADKFPLGMIGRDNRIYINLTLIEDLIEQNNEGKTRNKHSIANLIKVELRELEPA